MYEAESENVCMSRCAEFIQVVWRAVFPEWHAPSAASRSSPIERVHDYGHVRF